MQFLYIYNVKQAQHLNIGENNYGMQKHMMIIAYIILVFYFQSSVALALQMWPFAVFSEIDCFAGNDM